MKLTPKQLSYLRRYAAAGSDGTCQGWLSEAVTELFQAGYLEQHTRRITINPTRISKAGLEALAAIDNKTN